MDYMLAPFQVTAKKKHYSGLVEQHVGDVHSGKNAVAAASSPQNRDLRQTQAALLHESCAVYEQEICNVFLKDNGEDGVARFGALGAPGKHLVRLPPVQSALHFVDPSLASRSLMERAKAQQNTTSSQKLENSISISVNGALMEKEDSVDGSVGGAIAEGDTDGADGQEAAGGGAAAVSQGEEEEEQEESQDLGHCVKDVQEILDKYFKNSEALDETFKGLQQTLDVDACPIRYAQPHFKQPKPVHVTLKGHPKQADVVEEDVIVKRSLVKTMPVGARKSVSSRRTSIFAGDALVGSQAQSASRRSISQSVTPSLPATMASLTIRSLEFRVQNAEPWFVTAELWDVSLGLPISEQFSCDVKASVPPIISGPLQTMWSKAHEYTSTQSCVFQLPKRCGEVVSSIRGGDPTDSVKELVVLVRIYRIVQGEIEKKSPYMLPLNKPLKENAKEKLLQDTVPFVNKLFNHKQLMGFSMLPLNAVGHTLKPQEEDENGVAPPFSPVSYDSDDQVLRWVRPINELYDRVGFDCPIPTGEVSIPIWSVLGSFSGGDFAAILRSALSRSPAADKFRKKYHVLPGASLTLFLSGVVDETDLYSRIDPSGVLDASYHLTASSVSGASSENDEANGGDDSIDSVGASSKVEVHKLLHSFLYTHDAPHRRFWHMAWIRPVTVHLSKYRNIGITCELRSSDSSVEAHGSKSFFSRFRDCESMTDKVYSSVTYHDYSPQFGDEFKAALPITLIPTSHLFFTFYQVSLKNQAKKDPEIVGYAALPLLQPDGTLMLDGEYSLTVAAAKDFGPHYLYSLIKNNIHAAVSDADATAGSAPGGGRDSPRVLGGALLPRAGTPSSSSGSKDHGLGTVQTVVPCSQSIITRAAQDTCTKMKFHEKCKPVFKVRLSFLSSIFTQSHVLHAFVDQFPSTAEVAMLASAVASAPATVASVASSLQDRAQHAAESLVGLKYSDILPFAYSVLNFLLRILSQVQVAIDECPAHADVITEDAFHNLLLLRNSVWKCIRGALDLLVVKPMLAAAPGSSSSDHGISFGVNFVEKFFSDANPYLFVKPICDSILDTVIFSMAMNCKNHASWRERIAYAYELSGREPVEYVRSAARSSSSHEDIPAAVAMSQSPPPVDAVRGLVSSESSDELAAPASPARENSFNEVKNQLDAFVSEELQLDCSHCWFVFDICLKSAAVCKSNERPIESFQSSIQHLVAVVGGLVRHHVFCVGRDIAGQWMVTVAHFMCRLMHMYPIDTVVDWIVSLLDDLVDGISNGGQIRLDMLFIFVDSLYEYLEWGDIVSLFKGSVARFCDPARLLRVDSLDLLFGKLFAALPISRISRHAWTEEFQEERLFVQARVISSISTVLALVDFCRTLDAQTPIKDMIVLSFFPWIDAMCASESFRSFLEDLNSGSAKHAPFFQRLLTSAAFCLFRISDALFDTWWRVSDATRRLNMCHLLRQCIDFFSHKTYEHHHSENAEVFIELPEDHVFMTIPRIKELLRVGGMASLGLRRVNKMVPLSHSGPSGSSRRLSSGSLRDRRRVLQQHSAYGSSSHLLANGKGDADADSPFVSHALQELVSLETRATNCIIVHSVRLLFRIVCASSSTLIPRSFDDWKVVSEMMAGILLLVESSHTEPMWHSVLDLCSCFVAVVGRQWFRVVDPFVHVVEEFENSSADSALASLGSQSALRRKNRGSRRPTTSSPLHVSDATASALTQAFASFTGAESVSEVQEMAKIAEVWTQRLSALCRISMEHATLSDIKFRKRAVRLLCLIVLSNWVSMESVELAQIDLTVGLSDLVSLLSTRPKESTRLQESLQTFVRLCNSSDELLPSVCTSLKAFEDGDESEPVTQSQLSAFDIDMRAMLQKLSVILNDSIEISHLRSLGKMADTTIIQQLYMKVALAFSHMPKIRVQWLRNLAQYHLDQSSHSEAAQCFLEVADLLQNDPRAFAKTPQHPSVAFALISCYRKAIDSFDKCSMYERCAETYKSLMPLLEEREMHDQISSSYEHLSNIHRFIADDNPLDSSRVFASYYRIAFYGYNLGERLDGHEFIYRFPTITRLGEVTRLMQSVYSKLCGRPIKLIRDSGPVDVVDLDDEECYVQITYVEPVILPADADDMTDRQLFFNRHMRVQYFSFSSPFTKSGKNYGEITEQMKRKCLRKVLYPFPYLRTSQLVVDARDEELNPVQSATEDLIKRTDDLLLAVASSTETAAKRLTQILAGCVSPQVHGGAKEVADAFLSSGAADELKLNAEDIEKLKSELSRFLDACKQALQTSRRFLSGSEKEAMFQELLEGDFEKLCLHFEQYIG